MATDLRTTALTALASIPADPANLLLYVADLTEALPDNQSKKMTLAALDARYPGAVSSVFGRAGAVVAVAGDYTASFITNVPAGGIAATTVQAAITELDTEKQPLDATLTAFAAQVGAADKLTYFTALDTFALTDFTPFARSILDDANEAAFKATVNLEIGVDVQAWDADLDTIAGLAKTDGNFIVGDGAAWVVESGATARASLGLAIGTNVQAWDADLDTLAGLAKTDGNFIVGDGAAWGVESGATARTSLGLGTIATQDASNVTISGGSITGITDLALADGGTGQSTAQAAINTLSNVAAATNEHVLTKDTASGNAIFKAAAGGSSLPVADTQTIVMGSADNTKLLRFEIDGFTAGATRVGTWPNADITVAGLEVANVFTAAQTIQNSANATLLSLKNTSTSALDVPLTWLSSFTNLANASDILGQVIFSPDAATGSRCVIKVTTTFGVLTEALKIDAVPAVIIGGGNSIGSNPLTVNIAAVGVGFAVVGTGSNSPQFSLYDTSTQKSAFGLSLSNGHYSNVSIAGDTIARSLNVASGNLILASQNSGGNIKFVTGSSPTVDTVKAILLSTGEFGIGEVAPTAMLQVEQTSTTAAKPALRLQQLDLSEEFIRFDTTVGAGNPTDTAALGAYYGKVRVYVEGVGAKWLALYDT